MKKLISFFLAAFMALSLFPLSVLASSSKEVSPFWTVPEGYNEHDYNACVNFLEHTDASGVKNGEKLNEDYDPNDPSTWYSSGDYWANNCYFSWSSDDEKRITRIQLAEKEFCGELDLSDCVGLLNFTCHGYHSTISNVDFTGCSAITYIELTSTVIPELDVSDCVELRTLKVTGGIISSLDLSANTSLLYLECRDNRLVSLELSDCVDLLELDCGSNNLSSLDVSSNTQLTKLCCYDNRLSVLDLSSNTALESLNCNGNVLGQLNVSGCTSLKDLSCNRCSLYELDISNCSSLESLSCSENALTRLDLSHCPALESVYCSNNALIELNVTNCEELSSVCCTNNQLTELDFSTNPKIYAEHVYAEGDGTVACDYNSLLATANGSLFEGWYNEDGDLLSDETEIDSQDYDGKTFIARFQSLSSGEYNDNDYAKLVAFLEQGDHWYKNGERLNEDYDFTDPATWGDAFTWEMVNGEYRIKSICFDYDTVSQSLEGFLDVSECTYLESLTTTGQQLTGLNSSGCSALISLTCSDNYDDDDDPTLNTLEIAGCAALEYFSCSNNGLSALDVSELSHLKSLNCCVNSLTELNLSANTELENLYCSGNSLGVLDLSNNHALVGLECRSSGLAELNIYSCSHLESIDCSSNSLAELDVSACTDLYLLYCYENKITELDLSNNTELYYLICYDNLLTEIDLSNNTQIPHNLIAAEAGGTVGFSKGWWDHFVIANANKDHAFTGWYDEDGVLLSEEEQFNLHDDYSETPVLVARFAEVMYNENDFNKLSAFLGRTDSDGEIIGSKFNESFEADNPATWSGVKWISVNGEQRVRTIDWSYPDTEVISGGVLDLSDCSMLESLECRNLHISRLLVNNDISLKQLRCYSNYLTTLDVSTCTSLEELNCQENNLTTLNVTNCVNLVTLYFSSEYDETNKVAAIDLSTNVNLERLDCASNKLKTLDVSNCPELVHLGCGSNELTELNVSANTKLTSLSCGDEGLTALDVSNNPLLEDLEVWGSKIAELDLSGNPLLQSLVVRQAGIRTLDLSNNTNLEYCDIYSDLMLKTIVLSDKTLRAEGIGYLGLRLSDYDSNHAHGITIGGSRFYGWYDGNGSLLAEPSGDEYGWESIDLSETETDTIVARFTQGFNSNDVDKLRAFLELTDEDGVKNGDRLNPSPEYADYSSTYDPNDPLTWACDYEYGSSYKFNWKDVDGKLRLSYVHLGSDWGSSPQLAGPLDLSDCTALQYLYVYNAGIGALNINGCSALEGLACPGNNLTELVLAGCPALTYVTCSENDIAELDLSQCPALTNLECGDNKLVSLDVSSNIELTELNCSKNKLTSLDVSNNNALTRLHCSLNKLLELDVSANTQLEMLYCDGNKLSEIDLSHNPSLEYFDFEYNKFTEIDFSNNPEIPLERLYAEGRGTIGCSNAWGGVDLFAYAGKNGFFSGWYDSDGNLISTENPYDVDGDSYDILTAHFDEHDYNEADLAAVLAFLEQENPAGNKVGTLLSERQQSYGYACFDYESDDPSTWFGVTWCVLDDELRVAGISWSNVGSWSSAGWYATDFIAPVSTTLDLSDFTALSSLECTGLNLTSIGLSGCESLNYVNCRFNKLKSVDLSSSPNIIIDSVTSYGKGTVGCYARSDYSYLYAYPEEGETFIGWYNDADELLSSNSSFYVSNSEDVVFKAVFSGNVPLPDGVTVSCNEGGEIEYSYEEEEDSLTVTWEADEGYTCTAIKVNGVVIATNPTSPYVIENLSQYAARDGEEIVVEVVFGLSIILGDVNGDGMVTATDISVLFAYVMNAGSLSADAMLAADVNGDGAVNATDASLLAQMVFGA